MMVHRSGRRKTSVRRRSDRPPTELVIEGARIPFQDGLASLLDRF